MKPRQLVYKVNLVAFFKKPWSSVGNDVIVVVLEFFHMRKLLKQLNDTILCLIPNMEQSEDVAQFRPIACCNALYKIISKMICNIF